jgi:RNA polymerase sigma-70 factor, ECF subfamily
MHRTQEEPNKGMVARAMAGDELALIAIYQWYKPKVQRFLHYRIGNQQAAEDLTTEVFLRVLRHLPDYRFRNSSFRAWLFQIARNLAVDYFRKQSVRNHEPLDEALVASGLTPETEAAKSMLSSELKSALSQLTEAQFDVIVMRFISDLPIAEVAEGLGKSESAVKSLQARGLKALYELMSEREVSLETIR